MGNEVRTIGDIRRIPTNLNVRLDWLADFITGYFDSAFDEGGDYFEYREYKPDLYFKDMFNMYTDLYMNRIIPPVNDHTGVDLLMEFENDTYELKRKEIIISTELLVNICMIGEDKRLFEQFMMALIIVLEFRIASLTFNIDFMNDRLNDYENILAEDEIRNYHMYDKDEDKDRFGPLYRLMSRQPLYEKVVIKRTKSFTFEMIVDSIKLLHFVMKRPFNEQKGEEE